MSDGAKKEAKVEPPERWSAQRKTEVVLRLLRGEDLVEVSREVQVAPPELEAWRRIFLETGRQGLKRRSRDPTERELVREILSKVVDWDDQAAALSVVS
ncbi:MAG: helix-turn-helix domain-containing protein [Gemmatimonadota bacterium]